MRPVAQALLVHNEEGSWRGLKALLEGLGFEVLRTRTCAETETALVSSAAPILIFTGTALTDGSWADVEALAANAQPPVPVIVVSRTVDIPLYLDVLERGASDFIVPPFRQAEVAHVIQGALLRSGVAADWCQASPGTRLEVKEHAQNHSGAKGRASHAEAGR
jgi:FixJ family two-component response regulator